jgi:preprotein translocase subunit YajC
MLTNIIAAEAAKGTLPNWVMPVVLGVLLVGMMAMSIIPQRKRRKEHEQMMNSLAVGTKIMTIGRMVGKIAQVNTDNTLVLNVGTDLNPTLIVIDRQAIGLVLENVSAPVIETPVIETPSQEKEEDPCGQCDIPEVEIPETPDMEFPDVKFPDEE